MFRPSLKPGDWLVLIFSIGIVFALVFHSVGGSGSELRVYIEGSTDSWIYPLDAEVELAVKGPLGETHIHIHDGSVRVSDSPCEEKICMAAGAISSPGSFIACLPNRVLIRIVGQEEGGVDGLAF